MKQAGFDHTQFKTPEAFKEFLAKFGFNEEPRLIAPGLGFEFSSPGLLFISLYNPLTGVRSGAENPSHEPGFAGYIGLEGDESKLKEAVKFIKKNAHCGEYAKNSRDYI